jgi:rod shape-determining protein MreD
VIRSVALRTAAVVLGFLVVQSTVVPHFSVRGYVADLLLMLAAAGGLLLGEEWGSVLGFSAGLATDLVVTTPFGLWALVGAAIGYGAGLLSGTPISMSPMARGLATGAFCVIGVLAFAALALLLGRSEIRDVSLVAACLMVGVSGAVASPLVTYSLRWAFDRRRLPGETATGSAL